MKYLISSCFILLQLAGKAQKSVYDCAFSNTVTQTQINPDYNGGCILFDGEPYNFSLNDNNTVTGYTQINIEPGFDSHSYNQGA